MAGEDYKFILRVDKYVTSKTIIQNILDIYDGQHFLFLSLVVDKNKQFVALGLGFYTKTFRTAANSSLCILSKSRGAAY